MTQRFCLMKGKVCVCFALFFIILSIEFWGFSTLSLLITQNIRYAPFIYKVVSHCFFILSEHVSFILLLLEIFSIYLSYKLLLQIFVNCVCRKILKACLFECDILLCQSLVVTINDEITFISNNIK